LEILKRRSLRNLLSTAQSIDFVKEELEQTPGHTRNSLAKRICEHFELRDKRNGLRTCGCRVVLQDLEKAGKLILPRVSHIGSHGNYNRMVRLGEAVPEVVGLADRVDCLSDLQIIGLDPDDLEKRKIWNELMIREHPQGQRRLMGCQFRYLIKSEEQWLGGLGFSACALRLKDRDDWIGWNDDQRLAYQERVISLSRFLIRKSVKCENLASRVMSLTLKRLGSDFEERYGFRPWLVESFVDTKQFSGGCYKASNWTFVGKTKGRGRNDRYSRKGESVKDIYVYVLEKNFRELAGLPEACCVENFGAIDLTSGMGADQWAWHEFGKAEIGDKRLTQRLIKIASDKGKKPSDSYSTAVDADRYAIKGYYNFLGNNNEELTSEEILRPHCERTVQRAMGCKRVFAIQDTSDLNYSKLKKCQGLGLITKNKNSKGTAGLNLHSLFLVDDEGIPLGIGDANCYAPELVDPSTNRNNLPIEEKESFRWLEGYRKAIALSKRCPNTEIVNVTDREGDIYEIYQEAVQRDKQVGVLTRAQHNRCLEGSELKLFEKLRQSNQSFQASIKVPPQRSRESKGNKLARPAKKERTAKLTVSYEKVTISPPKTSLKKEWDPITLYAIFAREKNPPQGAEPIHWFLLTTLEILSDEDAFNCVQIYKLRWRIEEFHRVLKSSCKVEKHQQRTADKLKLLIAIDMVIAWRVMLLALLGRKYPEISSDMVFSKQEWQVLSLAVKKKLPKVPPPIGQAMDMVGALGGYVKTRSNPFPGFEVLLRGLIRLTDIEWGFKLAIEYIFSQINELRAFVG